MAVTKEQLIKQIDKTLNRASIDRMLPRTLEVLFKQTIDFIEGYTASGFSGFSGYSGMSGLNGTASASGISGYSGRSGWSGFSGTNGSDGASGISGFSGRSGFSGYSGVNGSNGVSGTSGYSGYSGYSGSNGTSVADIVEKTSNFTFALADTDDMIRANSASTITATVPANASVAFPVKSVINIVRYGAGAVNLAAANGVTILSADSALGLRARYSSATLLKIDTDTWLLIGDLQ